MRERTRERERGREREFEEEGRESERGGGEREKARKWERAVIPFVEPLLLPCHL